MPDPVALLHVPALSDHDPPSTLLGVAMLGYTDQFVEAVAAVRMGA